VFLVRLVTQPTALAVSPHLSVTTTLNILQDQD
jgi:hypothetical protein